MRKKYLPAIYICLSYFVISFIMLRAQSRRYEEMNYSMSLILMYLPRVKFVLCSLAAVYCLFNDKEKIRKSGYTLGFITAVIFIDEAIYAGNDISHGLLAMQDGHYNSSGDWFASLFFYAVTPLATLLLGWFLYRKKYWELSAAFLFICVTVTALIALTITLLSIMARTPVSIDQ